MGHHNSTSASVLDAPVLSPERLVQFSGNRARARAAARRERLARPWRIRAQFGVFRAPATTERAQQERALRRAEARERRLAQFGRL